MVSRILLRAGAAAILVILAACTPPRPEAARPDPLDVVRIEPTVDEEDDDEAPRAIDPERGRRDLAARFPGVRAIDFLRVLVEPEERAGRCWSEIARPWETGIDLDANLDGTKTSASGIQDLKAQGWWPIYRAPEGHGFERRAAFGEIDLRVSTEVVCRCAAGSGVTDGASFPLELRFRWKPGEMPEVSANVTDAGKRKGLSPSITYGHLLTYDFATRAGYPLENTGRCGAHVILSILADPPIV